MENNTKNVGLLRGGQITAIVGWGIQVLISVLILTGVFTPVGGEAGTFILIIIIVALILPTTAFILSLIGWNKYGLSIAAGIIYIIGAVVGGISVFGIISAILLLVGGILILCGAKYVRSRV